MKITHIIWDIDKEDLEDNGDTLPKLPKEIDVPKELEHEDYDTIVDWASTKYCIRSCNIEA